MDKALFRKIISEVLKTEFGCSHKEKRKAQFRIYNLINSERVRVFKLKIMQDLTKRTYYIKIWKDVEDEFHHWDTFGSELEGLSTLKRLLAPYSPNISVVDLIAEFREWQCLVSREFKGVSLRRRILQTCNHPRLLLNKSNTEIFSCIDNLAHCLVIFNMHRNGKKQTMNVDKIKEECEWRLSYCKEHNWMAEPLSEGLRNYFRQGILWIKNVEFEEQISHGDLGLTNILTKNRNICLLDLGLFGYRNKYEDICRIYSELTYLGEFPLMERKRILILRNRLLRNIQKKIEIDLRIVNFFSLTIMLGWFYYAIKLGKDGFVSCNRNLINKFQALHYRRAIKSLLTEGYFSNE